MSRISAAATSLILCALSASVSAQCESLPAGDSDALVALQSASDGNALLQIDFDEGTVCRLARDGADIDQQAGAAMRVNVDQDELAVQASIDGSTIWLRLDSKSGPGLILDRATSEDLGLTDAEFLGDNSLLEASDFFIEFTDSVEIGGYEMRDVEVSVPRLDIPYDHYAGRGTEPDAEVRTVGVIGEELLEDLRLTLDFSNNRIHVTDAR